jgi:hypothetical protein
MEHDAEVLEYYDQPPSIKLDYQSGKGRRLASISTVLEIEGFAGPTILGGRGLLALRPSGVRNIQY